MWNPWRCAKCKEEKSRDALTELYGWGLYVCTSCIEAWLNENAGNPKEGHG